MALTTEGLVRHILSDLDVYVELNQEYPNDCIVGLRERIRAYDEVLMKCDPDRRQYVSSAVLAGAAWHQNDHVVPVKKLHDELMAHPPAGTLQERVDQVHKFLSDNLLRCLVSFDEHQKLTRCYSKSMPEPWTWGDDPWRRYDASDVPRGIKGKTKAELKTLRGPKKGGKSVTPEEAADNDARSGITAGKFPSRKRG